MHFFSYPSGLLLLTLISLNIQAAVNDIYPGDYFPANPGMSTLTLYGYDRTSVGPYSNGNKLLDGKISQNIAALRYAKTLDVDGVTVTPVAVLTWLDADTSPSLLSQAIGESTQGMGDLRLGVTFWPINDRLNAEYLALTSTIIAPTGSYNSQQILNSGENRWRYILSGGYQKDITPRLLFELSPEIVFYGDNDDYANGNLLEQSASYALTGYLRARVTRTWHVFGGAQLNRGGETTINGIAQNNEARNTRVSLGMTWFLPDQQQLILRYSKETDVENGFSIDQDIALRYQKAF